ncbi:MAG: nucleotidyltransferase substrate binding protein [Candidatus Hydrogenedentes bacterium]|nr:nucleotidyltransferase substrate binding protein [Candidatus Hydrogenedentota bacterium]MBI3119342.1 nucleotidyltransferase substrate binding protein [Candidatus Hydrogenedentota bacterium]
MSNANRWLQRLQNLNKAYARLVEACKQEDYSDLEAAGLIQTYEFTFELAWKTMKDKLSFEGYEVRSPRETIRKAFEMELIPDVDAWLEALDSRNLLSHTYDEPTASEAVALIKGKFAPMLQASVEVLNRLAHTA